MPRYQIRVDARDIYGASFTTSVSFWLDEFQDTLAPYIVVALIGFVAFIAEGLLATVNIPIAVILMVATVVAIFFLALQVARRM